jgi:Cysteine-rich CPXCG
LHIASQIITCPYCWQTFDVDIDLSVEEQRYVEDCFVCCRPIVIRYRSNLESVVELSVEREDE